MTERICNVDSCERPAKCRRLMCDMHQSRMTRTGGLDLPPWPSIEERFFAKVQKRPDGCWFWVGSHGRAGYGLFQIRRQKNVCAHRWSYEHLVGPIPDGLQLDHLCRKPPCVNPAHLEPVTPRENVRRSESTAGRNARKTHCPQGHEYSPENTRREKDGARGCRTCRNARDRQKYWSRKNATQP